MVFDNKGNTKTKTHTSSPNKFFAFFVFKIRKQFLNAEEKQAPRSFF